MFAGSFTLKQLQEYVSQIERVRGFDQETALEKCLHLGEEVGELFKAVRLSSGMSVDRHSTEHQPGEELADILNFLVAIANRLGVDLEAAYREKEERNSARLWSESAR